MKKIVAIFTISIFLLNVIRASELTVEEKWAKLRGMNCSYEETKFGQDKKVVDLNSILDAKPVGYKVRLQYTVNGIKETVLELFSTKREDGFDDRDDHYSIDIYEERINEIGLYRLGPLPGLLQLAEFPSNLFDSDAPTEVVVAITDDNTLTVTVEGKTLLTYSEEYKQFPVNYVAFIGSSLYHTAKFYYNCTSEAKNRTMDSKNSEIENSVTEPSQKNQETLHSTPECRNKTVSSESNILITELGIQRQEITRLSVELQQNAARKNADISRLTEELEKQRQANTNLKENLRKQQEIVASLREFYGSIKSLVLNSTVIQ